MPAAAVIPAPVAYINVVAVKKLVVEFLAFVTTTSYQSYVVVDCVIHPPVQLGYPQLELTVWIFYCEKIGVFKTVFTFEHISMG